MSNEEIIKPVAVPDETQPAAEVASADAVQEAPVAEPTIGNGSAEVQNSTESSEQGDDQTEAPFDPSTYVEPPLEDNVEESVFVARPNQYKKGTIEWIREEHAIVSEHLEHVQEDFEKFSRILKLDHAMVHSAKVMVEESSAELTDLLNAQESLNDWIAERQNTYAWQLLDALNKQRTRIEEFEAEVKAWCDKPTEELYKVSLKHNKRFKRKLKLGLGGIIAAFSLGTIVNLILSALGLHLFASVIAFIATVLGIGNPFASVPIVIGGLSIVTWITALTTYFRDYLKFRRQLEEQVTEARFYLRAVKELSSQKSKISALHGQVQDYLVFMAEVLHKPWHVDEKWLNYQTSTINPEKLPASFQVAVPVESVVYRDVTKRAIEEFTSTNWRTRQFETLLAEYEKLYAMSASSLEPRINTDASIREKMRIDLEDSKILTSVGDNFVHELAKHLQKNTLPTELGFHVESIKPDSLAGLDLSTSILQDDEEKLNWHDFVTSILGQASGWSNLAYSIRGLEDKLPGSSSIRSFALIPERLSVDVQNPVEPVAVKKDDNSGVEVVVRVDVSSWIDPEKVKILNAPAAISATSALVINNDRPDVEIRG